MLYELTFPNDLRPDGEAVTYIDMDERLYLAPVAEHDFGFSDQLAADGLSSGSVYKDDDGSAYIRYPEGTDLITLPRVINATLPVPEARDDVAKMLTMASQALTQMKQRYNMVPELHSIDAVAVDQLQERAELLAPFRPNPVMKVADVLHQLKANAVTRCRTQEELDLVVDSFDKVIADSEENK